MLNYVMSEFVKKFDIFMCIIAVEPPRQEYRITVSKMISS